MFETLFKTSHTPKIKFARHLRRHQTNGEKMLWKRIRARRFYGYKFRRQVPIGPFIVDFLCIEKLLIIEVDGGSHFQPGAQEKDKKREAYLRSKGFDVLRVGNRQTLDALDWVLEVIGERLGLTSP